MPSSWVTWPNLGVDRDERKALRKAGVVPADILVLSPLDLVAATDEAIGEERADVLCRRATLLKIATPAWTRPLERAGIRDRDDLASRSPDDLFLRWQDVSPYTRPDIYKYLATTIAAAGGPRHAVPDGDELVRRAWVYRYGDAPPPAPTRLRLRMPTLKVNARVVAGGFGDDGLPRPPLEPGAVGIAALDPPTGASVFTGHWQWAGTYSAFLRLETLSRGDPIELVDGRTKDTFSVVDMKRGVAPLEIDVDAASSSRITLVTPRHLRWAPWLREWDLKLDHPSDRDLERLWVQVAVTAERDARG